jgi:hypothetical protein
MKKSLATIFAILLSLTISTFAEDDKKEGRDKGDREKRHAEMREKMKDMSPEERQAFHEKREAEMKERLAKMDSEQKQAFFEKVSKHMMEKAQKHLSSEELSKVGGLSAEEKFNFFREKKKAHHEKMKNMSEEERQAFRKEHGPKKGDDGKRD